jgi:hypothetical protein
VLARAYEGLVGKDEAHRGGRTPQAVAMKVTGHKTVSVYQRYRITSEDDIERALAVTQDSNKQEPASTVSRISR